MIEENMGILDRIIRAVLGLLFVYIALYLSISTTLVWVFIILALILEVTAISGFCPIRKIIKC